MCSRHDTIVLLTPTNLFQSGSLLLLPYLSIPNRRSQGTSFAKSPCCRRICLTQIAFVYTVILFARSCCLHHTPCLHLPFVSCAGVDLSRCPLLLCHTSLSHWSIHLSACSSVGCVAHTSIVPTSGSFVSSPAVLLCLCTLLPSVSVLSLSCSCC